MAVRPSAARGICTVFDGVNFWAVGGASQPEGPGSKLTHVYNLATGTWTSKALGPAKRFGGVCGISLVAEKIIFTNGRTTSPTASTLNTDEYYIANDQWSAGTPHPLALLASAGGMVNEQLYTLQQNFFHRYDVATSVWTAMATQCPISRIGSAAGVVGDSLYFVGDDVGSNGFHLFAYNTVQDTWTTLTSKPSEAINLDNGVCALGSFVYVSHGLNPTNSFEIYDTLADTWATLAEFPLGRQGTSLGCGNQLVMSFGGVDDGSPTGTVGALVHAYQVGASVFGDPHFVGFNGFRYYVETEPNDVYNLLTSPTLLVNAAFKHTPHLPPGHDVTIAEVGIWVREEHTDVQISVLETGVISCDPLPDERTLTSTGFEFVFGEVWVRADTVEGGGLMVQTKHTVIVVQPLNMALMFDTKVGTVHITPTRWIDVNFYPRGPSTDPMHGLVGQTTTAPLGSSLSPLTEYSDPFPRLLEGQLGAYRVRSADVFGTDFDVNLFGHYHTVDEL